MSDLISRQDAIDILDAFQVKVENGEEFSYSWARMRMTELPSAQPKIIYCGECKHMMPNGKCRQFADSTIRPSASDFCSAGERKDNG